ncbi:MAG: adenylate/guanylate cyclase domain-containing protein [Pseudomonadota bacterium]
MAHRFAFRHFRTRLLVVIVALVLSLQAMVFFRVSVAANENALRASEDALQVTLSSLKYTMTAREGILRKFARLLSHDFAFKTLVSESDHDTLISAFKSYRKRLNADWMFVVDMDGKVLADTLKPQMRNAAFEYPHLIKAAGANSALETSSIQVVGDRAYQIVVVPLQAPVAIAWVGIGFEITDFLAGELEQQTHTRVNLVWRGRGAGPTLFASTLDEQQRADYLASSSAAPPRTATHILTMSGAPFVAIESPLYDTADGVLVAALQRSRDEALAGYYKLRWQLIAVFAFASVLAALAALLIARWVTRPVQRLAAGAARISEGNYEFMGDIGARDELGKLASSFDGMVRGLIERDKVRAMLGKVVSPAIAEELLSQSIDFSGQEQEVSVLFSDIRAFTSLCEGRAPSAILAMLNEYLAKVSSLVDERNGVVDKYIGDAVMALFGAPLVTPDDPQRATETALAMMRALPALNAHFARDGWPALAIGVGIHTGIVVAGNIGSATRLNYTVLGDTVNLASRLEGLCKHYGVTVVVSEATMARCAGIAFRELDLVRVKGKREAVAIFEAVGMHAELDPAQVAALECHAESLRCYRTRDFSAALARFKLADQDEVARLYQARCEQYLVQPPADDWDAVETLTEK